MNVIKKKQVRPTFKGLKGFNYFFEHLRYRIILLIVLSIGIGFLDGFGLAMFVPLLELVNQSGTPDGTMMGKLSFIIQWMNNLGISLSLVNVLILMSLFFTLKGIVQFATHYYRVLTQQYFILKLRKGAISAFNSLRYKFFITMNPGRIQNTMSVEIERVSSSFLNYTTAIENGLLVIVYAVFVFVIDYKFAILISLGGLLTNLLYKRIYRRTKIASREYSTFSHLFQGQVMQFISGYKYLKATSLVKVYSNHINSSIEGIEKTRKKLGILNALIQSAREPLLIIIVSIVIFVHIQLLGGNLGLLLVSLLFFYRALSSLISMQTSWSNYLAFSGSMENLSLFQNEMKQNFEKKGALILKRFKALIELKDVSFFYNTHAVLKDINLKISSGETIAIVGESGSGKTTLINLLTGLMPPDAGEMIIDGHSIHEMDVQSLQKRIGYITQDVIVFNDTVYNNVTLWAKETKENLIRFEKAIKQAAIIDFINSLPDAHNAILENNGINLSGGQRQRISIARELYKDIDILIMDEATSSLDSTTEKEIQNSIVHLKGEFTIIIVSHRMATIRNADRIIIIDKGRIAAIGNYDDLRKDEDIFRQMIDLQVV